MALLNEALQKKKFDVRLLERNRVRGVLSEKEMKDVESKLDDDAESAEWVNLEDLRSK